MRKRHFHHDVQETTKIRRDLAYINTSMVKNIFPSAMDRDEPALAFMFSLIQVVCMIGNLGALVWGLRLYAENLVYPHQYTSSHE